MRHHAILVAAFLALLAADGHAGVSASARLVFQPLTLVDLDPGDGITPSITWGIYSESGQPSTFVVLESRASYDPQRFAYEDSYYQGFDGWANGIFPTNGPGLATVSGGMSSPDPLDPTQGADLFIGGAIDGAANGVVNPTNGVFSADFSFSGRIDAGSISNVDDHFVVSPMTRVIFSASATLTTYLDDPLGRPPGVSEFVYATAWFTTNPGGASAGLTTDGEYRPSGFFRSEIVQSSFENSTTSELSGRLYAKVEVNGFRSAVAPVPEPQAWALLVCGLLTVAGMARTRGQRHQKRGGE